MASDANVPNFTHIRAINIALDERDASTHDHCDRVSGLALQLGRHLGLNSEELRQLRLAARLHDVRTEAAKIVWPTRRETLMTTLMVVIMTAVLALFFFGVDSLFSNFVQWLLSWIA